MAGRKGWPRALLPLMLHRPLDFAHAGERRHGPLAVRVFFIVLTEYSQVLSVVKETENGLLSVHTFGQQVFFLPFFSEVRKLLYCQVLCVCKPFLLFRIDRPIVLIFFRPAGQYMDHSH